MYNNILENSGKVNIIHDAVMHLVKHLDSKPLHNVHILKINSKDLTYPIRGKLDDKRGKDPNFVIRKIYKGQEIACKKP